MSVIAVKGIPHMFSLLDVVKYVGKLVGGPFEPLNFDNTQGTKFGKTCYLRLSETLDPVRVVGRISSATLNNKGLRFTAFVPEVVPDLPLGKGKKKISLKVLDQLKLRELILPHEIILNTHHELFLEIQYKYPGLYNLSQKTSHKLLDEIARIIGDRLMNLMDNNRDLRATCFVLSKGYRRAHPHFGDFQLILSTLHRIQDAAGAPRAQIQESDLLTHLPLPQMIENVNLEKVKAAAYKYSDRVLEALMAHVMALDTYVRTEDTEEQVARKQVREELKKLMTCLPAALKQVIESQFIPEQKEPPHRRIRIYGEPFLPGRDAMTPFVRRYTASMKIFRSRRMYNLLMFRVAASAYTSLRAMDATVINGAKLTIRCSDVPLHPVQQSLRAELAAHYGGTPQDQPPDSEDDEEMDGAGD